MKPTNVRQFFKQFPDDETCLEHLFNVRFGQGHVCPKCERAAKWYRLQSEQAFSCQWCGHHIHPMVGTIFEKSRTPLQLWFYAIFLFTTSRHGVSGKELQRQLGVTYKTAWRMAAKIREHMAAIDGDEPIGGRGEIVEVDETYYGGAALGAGGHWRKEKAVIMGMLERGGDVVLKVVESQKAQHLMPPLVANVKEATEVLTCPQKTGPFKMRVCSRNVQNDEENRRCANHVSPKNRLSGSC
ncbi:IS1595 family transposase, partial [Maritimibacter sp. 55A14]|uniref:IS1595 family transposase n=1 Tax=Maritimibacter sp. 55A14 TaxID=2174844 RepID=UPI000D61E001